jgi:Fic family protein
MAGVRPKKSIDYSRLDSLKVPLGTSWLLADCMEARGKQELWTRQRPEVLAALREQALIQSVESSNRIEGVTVSRERLRPVVLGKVKPRDRSEEELAGYRRALDWIYSRRRSVRLEADVIRKLHALAQKGASADAGEWKRKSNEIIELLPGGGSRVRFVPAEAKESPRMVAELCSQYERELARERMPGLLLLASAVFDFLCIHPFRDGNGRVSRLLTQTLLEAQGFQVGRYVSLERLVEGSKEEYYEALRQSSVGWHEGNHDLIPWWNYFLGVLRAGYKEFADKAESRSGGTAKSAAKTAAIREAALGQGGPFQLADLSAELTGVSSQMIRKVLTALKSEGKLRLSGRGRGAWWEKRL